MAKKVKPSMTAAKAKGQRPTAKSPKVANAPIKAEKLDLTPKAGLAMSKPNKNPKGFKFSEITKNKITESIAPRIKRFKETIKDFNVENTNKSNSKLELKIGNKLSEMLKDFSSKDTRLVYNPKLKKVISKDKNNNEKDFNFKFKFVTSKKMTDEVANLELKNQDTIELKLISPDSPTTIRSRYHKDQSEITENQKKSLKTISSTHKMTNGAEATAAAANGSATTTHYNFLTNTSENSVRELVNEMLNDTIPNKSSDPTETIENLSWHDFSDYKWINEPQKRVLPYVDDDTISKEVEDAGNNSLPWLGIDPGFNYYPPEVYVNHRFALDNIKEALKLDVMAPVVGTLKTMSSTARTEILEKTFMNTIGFNSYTPGFNVDPAEMQDKLTKFGNLKEEEISSAVVHTLVENVESRKRMQDFDFMVFEEGTINLGLRLLYRQEWKPLGTQRGELVKTLPLGPKQVEKVSVKVVKRAKKNTSSEQTKMSETNTETMDTTKDSSEIVSEASSTFGWSVEASASANFGFGSASVSAGAHGENSQSSKEASSSLSESMKKMASKVRNETKVMVSTEMENTFESTYSSEIQNPNDEVALTYVYSKMQRQYEVFTSLAEVSNVIYVAEPVPRPNEITLEWIRENDWIISKALLDESFRTSLELIIQSEKPSDYSTMVSTVQATLSDSRQSLKDLAKNANGVSVSAVDFMSEANRGYRESVKESEAKKMASKAFTRAENRIIQHIKKNILHYCKAIWQSEDPQQRILRYKNARYKINKEWTYQLSTGEDFDVNEYFDDLREAQNNGYAIPLPEGNFEAIDNNKFLMISDIIDSSGPLGYAGNYAIFSIKPEYRQENVFQILNLMKSPYIYYRDNHDAAELMDPAIREKVLNYQNINTVTMKQKEQMIKQFADLYWAFQDADNKDTFMADDNTFLPYLAEFLATREYRREQATRFLLDTNNLVVDIEMGEGSALEKFKLAHRAVDVEKSLEEKRKLELENLRRIRLIEGKQYIDPQIDKLIVEVEKDAVSGFMNAYGEGSEKKRVN